MDTLNDPGQTTKVIARHPETAAAMKAAYAAYWSEARPLMVNETSKGPEVPPYHAWFAEQEKSGGIPAWEKPQL